MASFASSATTCGARKHAWTNTPGTPGGPGGRDRTLAVKLEKMSENSFCKN